MSTTLSPLAAARHVPRRTLLMPPLLLGALLGFAAAQPPSAAGQGPAAPATPAEQVKRVKVGPNVHLEVAGKQRRVLVDAVVCLREGALELLLCRKKTKEHEAVLAADVDGRDIHKALLLAGAEPGSPVVFEPKYRPARGQTIRVLVRYEHKGGQVTLPAQSWVRQARTGKQLAHPWIFAGSKLVPDPLEPKKPPIYLANSGDLICVSNFDTALLDLPVESTKENEQLVFEAFTQRIPPLDTRVTVILEPVPPAP